MPARDEEEQIGKLDIVRQPRGQRMGFEMIDRDERTGRRKGQSLGGGQADDDAADQAGSGRRRHAVELADRHFRALQGLGDDGVDGIDMGAGRDFRHDAAIDGMLLRLRQDHVGQDMSASVGQALDHRGGRFVASGLDAENAHEVN